MSFTPIKDRISYGGAVIGPEEREAILKIIDSQGGRRWTVGPESVALEEELAEATGVKKAILVNSGSSALLVGLSAFKFPKGSKVIIPAVNFPTAFNSILQCGLLPVVVDVDINTLNIDLEEVKKAIELHPDIVAVIAVDIAGNPVDLIELRKIVDDRKIILDDCDGYGTLLHDRFIETFADLSAVSFHAAHIITTGEGGAVLTDDIEVGERALKMREWGRASGTDKIYNYPGFPDDYKERYVYEEIGFNMKPLELQCAMGRIQLRKLPLFREQRGKNYKKMFEMFRTMPQFQLLDHLEGSTPCWFSFPLLCRGVKRGEVMDILEANNIECRTIFSGNILRHPAYKDTEVIQIGDLHNADDVMANGMFLSVHPSITDEMIEFIGKVAGDV
jgi:CDP-6-deoxy-D-xylo-4-hexulose-3-dehydrase